MILLQELNSQLDAFDGLGIVATHDILCLCGGALASLLLQQAHLLVVLAPSVAVLGNAVKQSLQASLYIVKLFWGSLAQILHNLIEVYNLSLTASNLVGHLLDGFLQLLHLLLSLLCVWDNTAEQRFQGALGAIKRAYIVCRHIVEDRANVL